MSTISEALKRATQRSPAVSGAPAPLPRGEADPFPEALPQAPRRPEVRPAHDAVPHDAVPHDAVPQAALTTVPQAAPRPPQAPASRRRKLVQYALVAGVAAVVLAIAYARQAPLTETRSAQAEPTVWREKIVDERQKLLAENDLPEEFVGKDLVGQVAGQVAGNDVVGNPAGAKAASVVKPAPEPKAAPERKAAAKAAGRHAPALKPAKPRGVLRAAAVRGDNESDVDEGDGEAPVAPRGRHAARAPKAAKVLAAKRGRMQPPQAFAQVGRPVSGPAAVRPPGALPASQFAYNAPRVVSGPVPAPAQAAPAPADNAALLRQGNTLFSQKRYDEAADAFRKAIATRETAVLHNNLGNVYLAQKKLEQARQEFTAAAALDPRYADPHYNLACYHALTGKPQDGLTELKQAKAIDPKVMESAADDGDLAPLRALPEYKRLTE